MPSFAQPPQCELLISGKDEQKEQLIDESAAHVIAGLQPHRERDEAVAARPSDQRK